MSVQMNNDRHTLLCHIAAIGLSVYDTMLYLDAHCCPEAEEYIKKRRAEYDEAVKQYESKYGPINWKGHPCEDVLWCWQVV